MHISNIVLETGSLKYLKKQQPLHLWYIPTKSYVTRFIELMLCAKIKMSNYQPFTLFKMLIDISATCKASSVQ